MDQTEVFALLEANKNERGIASWERLDGAARGLRSYGIGLTQLRKLARRVGRNRELAQALWESS